MRRGKTPSSKRPHHEAIRTFLRRCEPSGNIWLLRFDGGCDRNGHANAIGTWGFALEINGVKIRRHGRVTDPLATNNVAEWRGLLAGLEQVAAECAARESRPDFLAIEGDGDLIIRQIRGDWGAKKPHLIELRNAGLNLLERIALPWCARWIAREHNTECDALTRLPVEIAPPRNYPTLSTPALAMRMAAITTCSE